VSFVWGGGIFAVRKGGASERVVGHGIARAWEIENRRRQEELEDNELIGHDISGYSESDSELSMLGSSQFEGMEGIELGSGIELGGAGGGDALGDVSGDSEVKVSRFGRVLKQSRR
jgi:hypothetical protein